MSAASAPARVAIGMPVRNGERFLSQALAAIRSQTWQDFVLVICDNASTDGTADIASAAAARDPRVRHLRRSTPVGVTENFRFALESAVGTYFAWAAHDDVWDPRYLECLVSILDREPGVVLAFSKFDLIDGQGHRCPTPDIDWNAIWRRPKLQQLSGFLSLDLASHKANHIYGLIRRDALLARDEFFRYDAYAGADVLQLYALLCDGDFKVDDEVLFHYRIREVYGPPASGRLRYLWRRAFGAVPGHGSNLAVATRRHVEYYRRLAEVILARTPAPMPTRVALAAYSSVLGAERIATQFPRFILRELRRGPR